MDMVICFVCYSYFIVICQTGLGYFVRDDNIPVNITSYERNTPQFADLINQSFNEIGNLVRTTNQR